MVPTATIAGSPISKIGHGLMTMTWLVESPSDEESFASIIAGIDAASPGDKVFLNAGEFYGSVSNINSNLELLNRFFTKYPEYAERTFLSGGIVPECGYAPDCSEAGLERSVSNITGKLGSNKKLDLFQPGRVDPNVSIEETMATLNKYVESGKIGSISLSEVTQATLVHTSKVGKVAAVEIEVSPWSCKEETRKVIAKAEELGPIVAAYAPLVKGFLMGKVDPEKLPSDDYRHILLRFQGEAAKNNNNLVEALKAIAERKNITPAQLCLAWVRSLRPNVVPIPSSRRVDRTLENVAAGLIMLTEEDRAEINRALEANPVSGTRYPEGAMKYVWG